MLTLPENFVEYKKIDLGGDKKLFLKVNVLAMAVAVALICIGFAVRPLSQISFSLETLLKAAIALVAYCAYIFLHEAVHGVFFKIYCKSCKLKVGLKWYAAYCGSNAFYNKPSYVVCCLAPVVVWGIVLGVMNAVLPTSWFWVVWFVQIGNLSGAAGDFVVTAIVVSSPKGTLAQDDGVSMTLFSPKAD